MLGTLMPQDRHSLAREADFHSALYSPSAHGLVVPLEVRWPGGVTATGQDAAPAAATSRCGGRSAVTLTEYAAASTLGRWGSRCINNRPLCIMQHALSHMGHIRLGTWHLLQASGEVAPRSIVQVPSGQRTTVVPAKLTGAEVLKAAVGTSPAQ